MLKQYILEDQYILGSNNDSNITYLVFQPHKGLFANQPVADYYIFNINIGFFSSNKQGIFYLAQFECRFLILLRRSTSRVHLQMNHWFHAIQFGDNIYYVQYITIPILLGPSKTYHLCVVFLHAVLTCL